MEQTKIYFMVLTIFRGYKAMQLKWSNISLVGFLRKTPNGILLRSVERSITFREVMMTME